MASFLRQSELRADLSTLQALLGSLSPADTLGRLGLQSRFDELTKELEGLEEWRNNLASTALYFGGRPVVGSLGIDAEFVATAISDFQDLVVKLWGISEADVKPRGPVSNQQAARLHVTALLHGSVGFLIEEVDLQGTPLFPTPLKLATEEAVKLTISMGTESEEGFTRELEAIHPRVFISAQRFFRDLHKSEASIRFVDDAGDRALSRNAVDAAYARLEQSSIEESPIEESGLLLGLIPNAGRFEFKSESGEYREGRVSPTLSEAYLKRLEEDQGTGKWFNARLMRKEVRRFGRTSTTYLLIDLVEK